MASASGMPNEKPRHSLLAPLTINPKWSNRGSNGTAKPDPKPNPHPQPAVHPTRRSSRMIAQLDDMEPPPPIPAAAEERGKKRRPVSTQSLRWEDGAPLDSGYLTPTRRASTATASTTAWEETSPGASSMAGPSNSTRGRPPKSYFRNQSDSHSTHSADGGDEMDDDGMATPGSRRSANFHQGDYSAGEELETPIVKRTGFFSRLRNLGGASHARSLSGWTVESGDERDDTPVTPGLHPPHGLDGGLDEGAESDDLHARQRRSFTPTHHDGTMSAPTTPRIGMRRRGTMTDGEEGASDQPAGRRAFSRRASFKQRISRRGSRDDGRPGYNLSGYTKDTAAKWKALKAGIKMMGRRNKEKIDQQKSAELVAELSAGTPAALILASMFQRDEHGHRRIPILLEQLKVRISDSKHSQKGGRYQTMFQLDLEYGSGLTRMEWTVWREFRDFLNLHSRYRLSNISDTAFSSGHKDAHKLPKFPRETIPYLRGVRGLGSDDEDGAETKEAEKSGVGGPSRSATDPPIPGAEPVQTNTISPSNKKRPRFIRRVSSSAQDVRESVITAGVAAGLGAAAATGGGASVQTVINRHQGYALRQRQQLEDYLRRLIRMMVFRADSNRLCKFLELSALGVRLAAEGSYHGKEGYLIIRSSKGSDFRRPWNPHTVAKRHAPKWFLVRHSYIVCIDSPEEMNIYDVFLVDSNFSVNAHKFLRKKPKDIAIAPSNPARPQHHSLTIANHERTLKLLAKNERQLSQFQKSIEFMRDNTVWARPQRFDSFAPVRKGVYAQWLVDGRDYFWTVSRAIAMAKDVIYIHDWWLSPELYLRRPAAVSQKWRLDRLLQKKAMEGVKIFVIVYRNIGAAIPIDSSYTKYSLLDLHANIYVQRSPNQIRQQTFFWAHHEKILVVDHMIAFVGGIDLCFGRWDTPQHSVVDNKPSGFEEGSGKDDPEGFQLWPGKDYSNPRVQDFYNLDKPYEDMYDREKVPRMPWHDIHMQVVGQPARDLTRHFVQRWNYLLRQRTPSRPTPLLLPQPDFEEGELESLGVAGSCEVQILRSACSWSIGTPNRTEDSIHKAYIKSIELSEHLVYIENQFFITSCELDGTVIENKIGDALVERITRAYHNDEDWRAIILIPLMPGFQSAIDAQDGTSVRLIMHCQFRSISQGETSIFGRLKALGIEPEDYIQFFSLRNWGKIGSDRKLVTEQLYIHAKCMVVDDRIAIIGSANINERSMTGNRDSEVAAIVRDTDAIQITMGGVPFKVGRFPHTLRVRLMREHLGLDVDAIMKEERMEEVAKSPDPWETQLHDWAKEHASSIVGESGQKHDHSPAFLERQQKADEEALRRIDQLRSFNHDVDWEQENNPNLKARKKGTTDPRVSGNDKHRDDVRGFGHDHMVQLETERASLQAERSPTPTYHSLHEKAKTGISRLRQSVERSSVERSEEPFGPPLSKVRSRSSTLASMAPSGDPPLPPPLPPQRMTTSELGLPQLSQLPPLPQTSDADIGGPFEGSHRLAEGSVHPTLPPDFHIPEVKPDMFEDPLNDSFYLDVWYQIAKNNTEIYRQVFRCQPDNDVKTWGAYKEVLEYSERFEEAQKKRAATQRASTDGEKPPRSSNGSGTPPMPADANEKLSSFADGCGNAGTTIRLNVPEDADGPASRPRSTSHTSGRLNTANTTASGSTARPGSDESNKNPNLLQSTSGNLSYALNTNITNGHGSTRRRRRATTRSSRSAAGTIMDLDSAEKLLGMVQGHLVMFPYDWLSKEQETGNWLYNIDQLAPIEIYD